MNARAALVKALEDPRKVGCQAGLGYLSLGQAIVIANFMRLKNPEIFIMCQELLGT